MRQQTVAESQLSSDRRCSWGLPLLHCFVTHLQERLACYKNVHKMLLGVQRPWIWCIWRTFGQVYLSSICHILDSFFVQTYAVPPESCPFARFPSSSGGAALTGQLFRRLLVVLHSDTSSCGRTRMQQASSLALAACSAVLRGFNGMCQSILCMHKIGYILIIEGQNLVDWRNIASFFSNLSAYFR